MGINSTIRVGQEQLTMTMPLNTASSGADNANATALRQQTHGARGI
jgi:hypothetical protein